MGRQAAEQALWGMSSQSVMTLLLLLVMVSKRKSRRSSMAYKGANLLDRSRSL